MSRTELKELIIRIMEQMAESNDEAPGMACVFGDSKPCDATTEYAVGEEG